jgi:hypothetical protein
MLDQHNRNHPPFNSTAADGGAAPPNPECEADDRPAIRQHPEHLRAWLQQLNWAVNHRTRIIAPALDLADDPTVARVLSLMIVEVRAMAKALEDLLSLEERHG